MTLFSKETLDFLFKNHFQDNRDWFEEHKSIYQRVVLSPLCDLVKALTPVMLKIDPMLTTAPKVDKTICRIRRDTRFSHDKSLYRDHMWVIFKRGKMHGTEVPGIYFEISQHGFEYGCGFYHASPAYMTLLREKVINGDRDFQKAEKALASQQTFQVIGDCYKRPRYGNYPQNIRNWLERREICVTAQSKDFSLLFSDHLVSYLQEEFLRLSDVYHFFLKVSQEHNSASK